MVAVILALALHGLHVSPARPHAGGTFTASALVTGGRPTDVVCPGTVGTGPASWFKGRGAVDGQRVSCTWRIPPGSHGRTFRGTIAVSGGPRVARLYLRRGVG